MVMLMKFDEPSRTFVNLPLPINMHKPHKSRSTGKLYPGSCVFKGVTKECGAAQSLGIPKLDAECQEMRTLPAPRKC